VCKERCKWDTTEKGNFFLRRREREGEGSEKEKGARRRRRR